LILTAPFNKKTNHSLNNLIHMKTFKALFTTALLLSASAFAADLETAPVSEPAATPAADEIVVIRVNDEVITQADLQKIADMMLQHYQTLAQGAPISDEIKAQAFKMAEKNAIAEKLISIAVAGSDIIVTDEEVEANIAEIKTSIPAGMTFEAELAAQGMTLEDLKENIKTGMAARQLIESAKAGGTQAYIQSLRDSATIEYVKPQPAPVSATATTPAAADTHAGHNHN